MTWIKTIGYNEAKGRLKQIYERVKGPDNNVDNILMSHSLRPHTLEGHMTLYKYVLHHPGNTLPKWLLEAIGVYVSLLNDCAYCVDHHYSGLARLLDNDVKTKAIRAALEAENPSLAATHLTGREVAALNYAGILTRTPASTAETDINILRKTGLSDGEILEINQVTAYFAYANRTVLGLGITTKGDIIGLSPNDNNDPDNWGHQ